MSVPNCFITDRFTSANSTWRRICSAAGAEMLSTMGTSSVFARSSAFRRTAGSRTWPVSTTVCPVEFTWMSLSGKRSTSCRLRDSMSAVTSMVNNLGMELAPQRMSVVVPTLIALTIT